MNPATRSLQLIVAVSLITAILGPSGIIGTVTASGPIYSAHGVIWVDSDAELASIASSGSGAQNDPYIIQGYNIDAAGKGNAIYIGNTTAYLVVKNCILSNATEIGGTYQEGCGITVNNASHVIVSDLMCKWNSKGILLVFSNNNLILNVTSIHNDYGIFLADSNDNIIENSSFNSNNYYGIFLSSSNNVISNSTCNDNGMGMELSNSNNNIIENITSDRNGQYGIFLADSNDNIIENSSLHNNSRYGICLWSWEHSQWGTCNNRLFCNVLANNNGATSVYSDSHVQACDECHNFWNSSSSGNFWGDWTTPDSDHDGIVDSSYTIDGGLNEDHLPVIPLHVTISAPMEGTLVHVPTVLVTGTASPSYSLDINGILVRVHSDGSFSAVIPLLEGNNPIVASLSTAIIVSSSVLITYANTAPSQIKYLNDRLNETKAQLLQIINLTNTNVSLTEVQLASAIVDLAHVSDKGNSTANGLANIAQTMSLTRLWLQSVNDELNTSSASQVSSFLAQATILRSSLSNLSGLLDSSSADLNLTIAQVMQLRNELNSTFADLVAENASLVAQQSILETTQQDVGVVKGDNLALIIGASGLAVSLLAVLLCLMGRKNP